MAKKGKDAAPKHRAHSIPAAARKLQPLVTEGMLRRALHRGQVKFIDFGGLKRITDAEVERIRGLFESDAPNEAAK